MIELLSPSDLHHDPLNPRKRNPGRFELVSLSLAKLGFVLPLYASTDGMLLSGHQRLDAARRLGWQVPVEVVRKPIRDRAGLNLTFNRATNDFSLTDIQHDRRDLDQLRSILNDMSNTSTRFPCLNAVERSVSDLVALNADRYNRYANNAARQLASYGIDMPLITCRHGKVLNGIGRLQYASERGRETISAIEVDTVHARALAMAMNWLSMDFHLTDGFKDVLRANAYRRARQKRRALGGGYLFAFWNGRCRDFKVSENRKVLRETLGDRVLDFGSGHGDEARKLRKIGIRVSTFEPYRSAGPVPTRANGRRSAKAFLRGIADGARFSSIMLSSVLNSVPFETDRRHVITICAALCDDHTKLFAAARSRGDPNWVEASAGIGLGVTASRSARFVLTDEPGMSLSELNDKPKVQRYFQPSEFRRMFSAAFEDVTIGKHINNVTAICQRPSKLDVRALRAALLFEFELPYPEGPMGLSDAAIAAFSKRLGVAL